MTLKMLGLVAPNLHDIVLMASYEINQYVRRHQNKVCKGPPQKFR